MKRNPYRLRYMIMLAALSFTAPLVWAAALYMPAPAGSWMPAGGPQAPALQMVMVPGRQGGNWLAASFEGEGVWSLPAGPLTDTSWSRLGEGLPRSLTDGISAVALARLADGRLLAMLADGRMWVLADETGAWRSAVSPVYPPRAGLLSAGASGTLYFALHTLLYRSDDAGQHWSKLSPPPQSADIMCLLADAPAPGMLAIGTRAGELLITAADGASWQTVGSLGQGAVCRALAGDGRGGLYAAASAGLYHWRQENGRWVADAVDFAGEDVTAVLIAGSRPPVRFAALRHGGVWMRQAEDDEWKPVGSGLEHLELRVLALDEESGALYAGTPRGVWWTLIELPPAEPSPPAVKQTPSPAPTASPTRTRTPTLMPARTPTPSPTATRTGTRPTAARSPTATSTFTPSASPSPTSTASPTPTPRPTATSTPTETPAPTPTDTPARPAPATPTPAR